MIGSIKTVINAAADATMPKMMLQSKPAAISGETVKAARA